MAVRLDRGELRLEGKDPLLEEPAVVERLQSAQAMDEASEQRRIDQAALGLAVEMDEFTPAAAQVAQRPGEGYVISVSRSATYPPRSGPKLSLYRAVGVEINRSRRIDGDSPWRIAKLYLPPGQMYFGSREAHGLTYTSCQESGKFRRLHRDLAARMGTDEATIRRVLGQRASR